MVKKLFSICILGFLFMTTIVSAQTYKTTTSQINPLVIKAKEDPYQLSMPLLASSYAHEQSLYRSILVKMLNSLAQIPEQGPKNSYKAWLWGRVLLSAVNMQDKKTISQAKLALQALIDDPQTAHDAFSAWAIAYYAAADKGFYEQNRQLMLNRNSQLTRKFREEKQQMLDIRSSQMDAVAQENLQSKLSDTLWAWIMGLQAAANAQDAKTYHLITRKIKVISTHRSIAQALSKDLIRTSDSNDYPAWALSIVQVAAAKMHDQKLYAELVEPLDQSIAGAKKLGAENEALLAALNAKLAADLIK